MPLFGPDVTDGEAEGIRAVELRVREEDLAGGVDGVEQAFVQGVEIIVARAAGRAALGTRAEADDAERNRRQALEAWTFVHPSCEPLREPDVLGEALADAVGSEVAQHGPELQGAEPAAELHAGVHQVAHAGVVLRRPQELGGQGERGPYIVHSAAVEGTQIERREQPLVRIHDDGVRPPAAVHHVAHAGREGGGPRIGRVDVEPRASVLSEAIGNRLDRIDAGRRRRPDRRDDRHRYRSRRPVRRHRLAQRVGPHPEPAVHRNLADGVQAQPERHHRLVDHGVRLIGGVDGERRQVVAPCYPAGPDVRRGPVARGGQGMQGRDRRGVVDHAFEGVRQSQQLPEPAERHFLQFRGGGRRPPQHRLDVEGGGEKLGQNAGRAAGDGEVGEEAGVVPVGETRDDYALEVAEDLVEPDALAGRPVGQRAADVP